VCVTRMKSARVICASITTVSEAATVAVVTVGRGSSAETGSFGVAYFARVRYGSTRKVVLLSAISQPAVRGT
jgi:hypothetical protein